VISATESSNKFQKPRFFGRQKSVEEVLNTWAKCTGHTGIDFKIRNVA
jgi:hypothetical protein